ncbi:hypothetical protein [Chryseobacterium sp. Hurlbut01]|uniref:hypothetical protein n=1 Tax=Chryseobacterium sp. Hurlbut01 TaxID=1681828 RepID=UPI00128D34D3|nr:hypothetical protein [Chryseobacterium sp. Hurlbut01]
MKKNLLLRLYLIMIALLSLQSCQQDILQEQETYHNTSAFLLTSKRISLDEAKHKLQLLSKIEQVEHKFKTFAKSDAQGKMVNYANGVSIDTDNVIYIENGANFHTYTFTIKRANAPETAPLENLLLIPETDGSYKEFLVTYNLTAQEKEKVKNGEPVDTKGKTTITELAKGSFNSGGQLAKMSCNWQEETIWVECSDKVHNASNVETWHKCKAETPPGVYTIITGGCTIEQPETIDYPGGPGSGTGTGPGGSDNTDPGIPPNDCTSVATDPTQVGLVSSTGCNIGVPTQPNMPPEDNPCNQITNNVAKAKEIMNETKVVAKLTSIQPNIATDTVEKGFNFGKTKSGAYETSGTYTGTLTGLSNMPVTESTFTVNGSFHSHPTLNAYECISVADLYAFYTAHQSNIHFSTLFVLGATGSVYNLSITDPVKFSTFTGSYPENTYSNTAEGIWKEATDIGKDFEDVQKKFEKQGKTEDEAFALAQAYVLKKYDIGITISKQDSSGDFKPIFVKETKDPTDSNKTNYEQTQDCNL